MYVRYVCMSRLANRASSAAAGAIGHGRGRPLILTVLCGNTDVMTAAAKRRVLAELVNEFAAVRLSLDNNGNGPRLLVEDLEGDEHVFLCPLELASFTLATPEDRQEWLRVGNYRADRQRGRS
jgi:hypothetical protein